MPLFKPNVEKMDRQRDVVGLMRALVYPGEGDAAHRVRADAAECLARYPYPRVVEVLLGVAQGGSDVGWVAEASVRRILYPHYQGPSEAVEWWTSGGDTSGELRTILKAGRASKRDDEWNETRKRLEARPAFTPPARIQGLVHAALYGDATEEERTEARNWIADRDARLAPELAAARADLEKKWLADESAWEKADAQLAAWRP